jgi:hypothetical protein
MLRNTGVEDERQNIMVQFGNNICSNEKKWTIRIFNARVLAHLQIQPNIK